jgi:predicted nuclease of predicted toxin-antitoxin system
LHAAPLVADPPRFYLDVHIPRAAHAALLREGVDVLCGQDVGLAHASDEEHLRVATEMGRVLVSRDTDFLRIGYLAEHAGIVRVRQRASIGEILEALLLVFRSCSADDMRDRVEWL